MQNLPSGRGGPLSLRHNFAWTLVGNVIYAASQWGMLVVLAKLGSSETVGRFALGLAVTAPVIMFANLQLRVVQATDARREYAFSDYLGLRLITAALSLLAVVGVVLVSGYRGEAMLVILIVGFAKVFESVSDVFYGLLQQRERMDRIAVSMMVKGPLSLLLLAVCFYLTGSLLWGVIGLAAVWALILVCFDIPRTAVVLRSEGRSLLSAIKPAWRWQKLRSLAWLALPLGFVMTLISLTVNTPRYFVERHLGEGALGIFAAITYLQVAGSTVMRAVGQSAIPRIARYYWSGNARGFRRLVLRLVGVGVLLGVVAIVLAWVGGRQMLTILYRAEYAAYTGVFVFAMVAALFFYVSTLMADVITAVRYIRIQLPLVALALGSTAVGCLLFVPGHGLAGAVGAVAIANCLTAFCSLGIVAHAMRRLRCRAAEVSGGRSPEALNQGLSG